MFNLFKQGSMLTGTEIYKQVKKGKISIDPFDESRINPNSYNLSLNKDICIYSRGSTNNRKDIVDSIYTKKIDYTDTKCKKLDDNADDNIKLSDYSNHIYHTINMNNSIAIALDDSVAEMKNKYNEYMNLTPLDSKNPNDIIRFEIPEEGFILHPGVIYIGRTNEKVSTDKFIPMINGRSSGGRLGLSIHICAGFGDIGFSGTFTLEITVVEPLIIYPNMEIAQVCFHTPYGKNDLLYRGKYYNQIEATPSKMSEDFNK